MDMNLTVLVGRLTEVVRFYPGEGGKTPRATGLLAVNRVPPKGSKSKNAQSVDIFPIVAWGPTATNLAKYTGEGKELTIRGRTQIWRQKRVDGTWDNRIEVVCEMISYGHDSQKGKMQSALEGEVDAAKQLLEPDNKTRLTSLLKGKPNAAELLARVKEVAQGTTPRRLSITPVPKGTDPFSR